jgi:alkanesulfonate monooxygenase
MSVSDLKFAERLEIFSTCPQSKDVDRDAYVHRVADVSKWSESFGCTGILVYTDNGIADHWLVSQIIIQNTQRLAPLIAVQPIYMSPYTAAKTVSTLALLHGRRVYLNMLAGGFKNDLAALNDMTPHDDRYVRTTEYALIIKRLLESGQPVSFEGKYYTIKNLKMTPELPPELFPGILISGSSDAGMAAARAIGATAVRYPKPPGEEAGVAPDSSVRCGVRIGIIARQDRDEAWHVARERFPEDRRGQIAHGLAMKSSDSAWHKQLSQLEVETAEEDNPYWLGPFQNYKTFCPYLVGTYERVAREVGDYIAKGYRTFILDIPPSYEELEHTGRVFKRALELEVA